jgi:D-3-phosphoglycerate dehydrogenase / 2-oxoglutarate reductase
MNAPAFRVLCTCPPMILQIERFSKVFEEAGWDVVCPEFRQTLSESELIGMVADYDAWIIGDDPATRQVFEAGKKGRLRAAMKWGAGVDNVDFKAAAGLGIPISNTPGTFAEEVSDVAVGYLIGLGRGLFSIDRGVRSGSWPKPAGMTLAGKTAGVVGLGHIGKCLCRKLITLGLTLRVYDPFVASLPEYNLQVNKWPEGLGTLDFLILCCSLTNENKHLVNAETIALMKNGAYLINVGRGPLVAEGDLLIALQDGKIAGAALEVLEIEPLPLDSALRDCDNVIFGSHNSSNTVEAVVRTSEIAIEKLKSYLAK